MLAPQGRAAPEDPQRPRQAEVPENKTDNGTTDESSGEVIKGYRHSQPEPGVGDAC